MQRHAFEAMGTTVELLLVAEPSPASEATLRAAEAEIRRLEALLSRFQRDSELAILNREGSLLAGPDLVRVTQLALAAREHTHGRFDPTVHDALVAAGYDRTFEEVSIVRGAAPPNGRCGGRVSVDTNTGLIELEPGVRLDLGGIAKGDAVDRACALSFAAGPCLVNGGGDLAVLGAPEGGVWPIAVETARGTLTLGLARGALATSGRDRRRWSRAGKELHHLIDPTTALPSTSDLLRVTVAASTAAEAEVLATSLFLAGEHAAVAEANAGGIPSILVTADGRTIFAGGFA
jgi:thiamine biosynthesis lipoprotein